MRAAPCEVCPDEVGRDALEVQQAMLDVLFPLTPHDVIWQEYQDFSPIYFPEQVWQFSRQRYRWAKAQWPNLSGRLTTVWTLQDFGLLPKELDVRMIVSVADGKTLRQIKIHTQAEGEGIETEKETIAEDEGIAADDGEDMTSASTHEVSDG